MNFKTITAAFISVLMLLSCFTFVVSGEEAETIMYHVDSLNGTRWADLICVYKDVATTKQNEWGENVVVDSNGVVTQKIPGGDIAGKNLAVPDGGYVVSGTGDIGKAMYAAVEIGDKCFFDEYAMRVYFSKGEIDLFYTKTIQVTGYNETRWSNTVIIYDKSGEKTGTNPYGYEACVDKDGYIVSVGGNDNVVPEGGYVISVIESADISTVKLYFTVGAKCILKKTDVTAVYSEKELGKTVEMELEALKNDFEEAKKQYRIIDYSAAKSAIDSISVGDVSSLDERNSIISQIREAEKLLIEDRNVETRSVWYTVTETTSESVKKTVAEMKEAGINELVLSSNTARGTIVPIDTEKIPFKRDPVARRIDLLQEYIDECHANGISLVVLVPIMGNDLAEKYTEWYDVTNTGEKRDEIFYSPANEEYRKAMMDYIRYILTNYDVDGFQLDYIRYPQLFNGVDGGYDDATIALFKEKTGLGEDVVKAIGKQLEKHPKWSVWHSFKVELINSWVKEIYDIASELRPDVYVTAAVAANSGVSAYCQDPAAWIKGGYIDGIYVMSYEEGINMSTVGKFTEIGNDKSFLVMGCGAYLSITNESLVQQTVDSRKYGSDGTAYFEWGAVKDHGYTKVLNGSLFKEAAIPFTSNTDEAVNRLVASAKERIALYCQDADEETAKRLNEAISKLSADKDAIKLAIESVNSLAGDKAKYLVTDLDAALRAINMKKPDFEFKKPVVEDTSSDVSEEASQESSEIVSEEIPSEQSESGNWWIYVVIAVAVVIVAAIAVIVIKKKK